VDLACSARELRWLWALRGALEGVLAAQASRTATVFLGFCAARCAEHAAQRDCLHEARIHLYHVALPVMMVETCSKARFEPASCLHARVGEGAADGSWLHGPCWQLRGPCSCSSSSCSFGAPPVREQRQAHRTACMHI